MALYKQNAMTGSNLPPLIDEVPYLKELLSLTESRNGIKGFNELCRKGCDPHILGRSFIWLYVCESALNDKSQENIDKDKNSILSDYSYSTDSGEFDLENLQKISKKARELREEINRLKNTGLVRYLSAYNLIKTDDLLSGHPLFPDNRFFGILNIVEFAKELKSSRRPDRVRLGTEIYQHIYEKTGDWNDEQVAYILNDLFPNPDNPTYTEACLRQWRYRQRLVKPKKNTTKKSR